RVLRQSYSFSVSNTHQHDLSTALGTNSKMTFNGEYKLICIRLIHETDLETVSHSVLLFCLIIQRVGGVSSVAACSALAAFSVLGENGENRPVGDDGDNRPVGAEKGDRAIGPVRKKTALVTQ